MIAKISNILYNMFKREEEDIMLRLSEHFTISEAICYDTTDPSKPCPYCHGIFVPCDALLTALEAFRSNVNAPVVITSWTRCSIKEARMKPGVKAPRSEHNYGRAVDCYVTGLSGKELYDAAMKVDAFKNGGIGVYVKQSSGRDRIHLDVRETGKGRWGYLGEKEVTIEEALQHSK
jgi:hypothetical protein